MPGNTCVFNGIEMLLGGIFEEGVVRKPKGLRPAPGVDYVYEIYQIGNCTLYCASSLGKARRILSTNNNQRGE
jgi:hypothetical protein